MLSKKGFLFLIAFLVFVGQASACPGDFNGDNKIDISDFLLFVEVFGTSTGDANYNALMDMDGDDKITISDFLSFVGVFGTPCKTTSLPPGDGATDRAALVALYNATDGDNWKDNTNWLSDRPLGEWFGVTTDDSGRVTHLFLNENQLSGQIPAELGNLSELTHLFLYENQLSGQIPITLGNLSKLEDLRLYANQLSGAIPAALGNLSNLILLSLYDNQLSGAIPTELGNLSKLEVLDLQQNQFSGQIPAELGNLSNLSVLILAYNQLNGQIPKELGNLSNLQFLILNDNQLNGQIPAELGNLSNLKVQRFSSNPLSGCVPEGLRNVLDNDFSAVGLPFCGDQVPTFNTPTLVAQHDDRVVVMGVPNRLRFDPIDFDALARVFFEHYEDAFDYLMFFSNLSDIRENRYFTYYGIHHPVQNTVQGTGKILHSRTQEVGAAGKLNAILHFPYNQALLYGPSLHEIMHSWANYAIPTTNRSHWGFSSANGQLGGFDRADLVDHGGGRYSAGRFGTFANGGNSLPYSPIELYFMGLIPPAQVPALWVAEDGAWSNEQDTSGNQIFTASQVSTWSIDRIVAEHGARIPDSNQSQKHFRAALILIVDALHPAEQSTLDDLSSQVKTFTHTGPDASSLFNFWEATGGRATLTMDGLSAYRKPSGSSKRKVSYRIVAPVDEHIGCIPMGEMAEAKRWMVAPERH